MWRRHEADEQSRRISVRFGSEIGQRKYHRKIYHESWSGIASKINKDKNNNLALTCTNDIEKTDVTLNSMIKRLWFDCGLIIHLWFRSGKLKAMITRVDGKVWE